MTNEDSEDEKNRTSASPRPSGAPPAGGPEASGAEAPSQLSVLGAERDKLKDQLLRTAADFDNYRKRSKRDVDDARQRGKDELIRDLLPVFDNLERASQSSASATDLKSVVEGVRMVLKLFEDTAERLGLTRIGAVGERFDPALHEAIQQVETNDHPAGTIVAQIAAGYRFGDRLVRPAMVVVARKPSAVEQKPADPPQSAASSASDEMPADKPA